jgi:peptidyl-prolyl cis-trans isomerase C
MTSEQNRPQLNLGDPPGSLRRVATAVPRGWLILIVLLQLALLGLFFWRPGASGDRVAGIDAAAASPSRQRELAHELENRSLYAQAAEAWQEYLHAAPQAEDRAEVWFRIGRLFLQAEQFERAAAALLRCELAAEDNPPLRKKVGPELVTCLRRLGLYGEVGRELSRRVEAGAEDVQQGKVLATLAGEPLTEADLDRRIERRVDQMLALQGAAGGEAVRQQLLEQFARPEMRRQLFDELLQTELFTRRARELGLDREPEYLAARQAVEDSLLASRFQARELAKIQPTDVDLEAFYKLDEARYRLPETLAVRIEPLQANEQPASVLEGIQAAEDFRQWQAKRRGEDAAAKDEPPETLVRGQPHPQLGNVDPLFDLEPNTWTKEPIEHEGQRFLVLVEAKSPARTPPLAEIRDRVHHDYVARKRDELSRHLADELMQRYRVQLKREAASGEADAVPEQE